MVDADELANDSHDKTAEHSDKEPYKDLNSRPAPWERGYQARCHIATLTAKRRCKGTTQRSDVRYNFLEQNTAHSEKRLQNSDGSHVSLRAWKGSGSNLAREKELERVLIAQFLRCHVLSSPVLLLFYLKAVIQGIHLSCPVSIPVEYSSRNESTGMRFVRIL
eukprot:IDg21177t1